MIDNDIAVARWKRKFSRLRGAELDAIGRRLLIVRNGLLDAAFCAVLARAQAGVADAPAEPKPPRAVATHEFQVEHEGQWLRFETGTADAMAKAEAEHRARWTHMPCRVIELVVPPKAPRPRKTWSVRDADHLRVGARVMLARSFEELRPREAAKMAEFGQPPITSRMGRVVHRYYTTGLYVVSTNSPVAATLARAELVHPIPMGVVGIMDRAR